MRGPTPAYATARNPAMLTDGRRCSLVAGAMGTPFIPWQDDVVDVALEWDPVEADLAKREGRYRPWRYQVVVVLVPRQAGKTVLMRGVFVDRALTTPKSRLFMTAQMGKDATERWNDLVDAVDDSPLSKVTTKRISQGSQHLAFPNGSKISPFAPGPRAVHGYSPPAVGIDEGWAFGTADGEALMAAVSGAMLTRDDKQLWIISAAGTAESTFLLDWVAKGRASIDDPTSRIAYFEYSAPPKLDTYDPAAVDFHPGLGHLVTRADLAAESQSLSRGVYERNILNRWTSAAETVMSMGAWAAMASPWATDEPLPDRWAIGFAVAADRVRASVWASWEQDGKICYQVIQSGPGAAWLPGVLADLHLRMPHVPIAADGAGPERTFIKTVTDAGVPVRTLTFAEFAESCDLFKDSVRERTARHDGSPALTTAMTGVRTRAVGDRTFAWSSKNSNGPIDALNAASVAGWAVRNCTQSIQIF